MAEDARIVRLMLELIKQEFPDFNTNPQSQVHVSVALAAVCGTMGAFALLTGGEDRLAKMIRMIATRTDEMAHAGAKAVQQSGVARDVLREGGPLSGDEAIRRILKKSGRIFN